MKRNETFTIQVLDAPVMATLAAKLRGFSVIGFFDMTVDIKRPETLMLVEGDPYKLINWHDEESTLLVWSIPGDYLSSDIPGAA